MKHVFILYVTGACLGGNVVFSQTGSLRGRVIDSSTRTPVPLATVKFSGQRAALAVTDSSGVYRLTGLRAGDYRLHISSEGYRNFDSAFVYSDSATALLPDIRLVLQVHELDRVFVRTRPYSIIPRADGYLYRINGDLPVAGERAPDLLRRLPGLQVSPDGNPSVNGSARIKVVIDGKPSEFTAASVSEALGRIPAEMVASVEVITHPSAKYEAEGVDGVILITTKRLRYNAVSGNINATVLNRTVNGQANLLARSNGWLFDADAGYNYSDIPTVSSLGRQDNTGGRLQQDLQAVSLRSSYNGGVGITALPDSLGSVSLNYRYGLYHDHILQGMDNRFAGPGADTFYRQTENLLDRPTHSLSGGFNRRSPNRRNEYTLLLNVGNQRFYNPYEASVARQGIKDYGETNDYHYHSTQLVIQSDLSFTLRGNSKLETGFRYPYSDYTNQSTVTYTDPASGNSFTDKNRSSSFAYRTLQPAAYISYAAMPGKYSLRTGLRFERTVFTLFSKDSALNVPQYTNWLPTLLLSRNVAGRHTLAASFAARLQRPFIVWLNPVVYYIDSLNIERGNPALQAVRIRNYNLSYTARLKNTTLNAAMVVIYSKGNIEPVRRLLPGGVAEKTWVNISSNTAYGLSAGFNYQDAHWSVNLNHTLNRLSFQGGAGIASRSAWLLQNSAVINYTFAKSWTLASYLTLNTNTPTLQGTVTGTRWYNLLLIKKVKGDHLSAAIRFDNFFTHYQYVTEEINTSTFTQTKETRTIYRFFRFSLSWKIGRKEIRLPAARRMAIEN